MAGTPETCVEQVSGGTVIGWVSVMRTTPGGTPTVEQNGPPWESRDDAELEAKGLQQLSDIARAGEYFTVAALVEPGD